MKLFMFWKNSSERSFCLLRELEIDGKGYILCCKARNHTKGHSVKLSEWKWSPFRHHGLTEWLQIISSTWHIPYFPFLYVSLDLLNLTLNTALQTVAMQRPWTQRLPISWIHKWLLDDHETQSGPWWSTCRSRRLYKSLLFAGVEWTWEVLTSKWSDKKLFVSGSSTFNPYQVHCQRDSRHHCPEAADSVGDIWVLREGRSYCFHAAAMLIRENSSKTRQDKPS